MSELHLEALIIELLESDRGFQETLFDGYTWRVDQAFENKGITFEEVEQHGGEGEGEEYYRVYCFTKDDEKVYVKFDGSYYSYSGSTYHRYYVVKPKLVEVIQYHPA